MNKALMKPLEAEAKRAVEVGLVFEKNGRYFNTPAANKWIYAWDAAQCVFQVYASPKGVMDSQFVFVPPIYRQPLKVHVDPEYAVAIGTCVRNFRKDGMSPAKIRAEIRKLLVNQSKETREDVELLMQSDQVLLGVGRR